MDGWYVILTILYQLLESFCMKYYDKMIIFSELGITGEDEVITFFKVLYRHLPGGTEKNHENLSPNS
jgi:hypothetical protein